MKNNITYLLLLLFFSVCNIVSAQDLRVIDNKGTRRSINKITQGTSLPTNPVKGDINYNSFTNPTVIQIFDGTTWRLLNTNQLVNYLDKTTTPKHKIGEIDNDNNLATTNVDVFETVTLAEDKNTSTDVKTVATYKNENGVAQNIEETVTKIDNLNPSPDANKKLIGRYHKEDATIVDIKETITKIEQVSGATPPVNPVYDAVIGVDSPGDIKYFNEINPTGIPQKVRVVSTNPNNKLKIGADGGAYYNPLSVAGVLGATGSRYVAPTCTNCLNVSSVSITNISGLYWDYLIRFVRPITNNYVVNITPLGTNNSIRGFKIYSRNSTEFVVRFFNAAGSRRRDTDFMFNVVEY